MKPFLNLLLVLLLSPSTSLIHASDEKLQDRTAAIDALFSVFDREGAPGASVMVIQDGKVMFKKAYGSANLEEKIPSATTTNYSNTGYAILALVVEAASGMPFQEFMAKNIFDPLKMTNTVFYKRDDHTDQRRAYGYSWQGDKFERTDQSLTSHILGDGAIYTSVEDYAKWDQGLYTTKLVRAETLREAFTPGAVVDKDTGYGFG